MSIVLGTFTSSSTKFVDLSYYCRDSMKALQPLFAKNARRSSSTCCRRQTKQWTKHTIVFSFQLFCFAKSRICAYFTVNVQIMRIHALCFILREFCSKIKPQKERWNFPFILARARSRLCHKWLRSEVSKMERGSQNIHGGGHWVTQYRNTVKKKWQKPKYRVENRPNTDTAYFNHIYNRFRILMVASSWRV